MLRAEKERHVAHRLVREERERLRVHAEDGLARELRLLHEALRPGDEPVLRVVLTRLEGLRIHEPALHGQLRGGLLRGLHLRGHWSLLQCGNYPTPGRPPLMRMSH